MFRFYLLYPRGYLMVRYIVASDTFYVNHVQDGFINILNEGSPDPEYYYFSSLDSANKIASKINSSGDEENIGIFKVIPF